MMKRMTIAGALLMMVAAFSGTAKAAAPATGTWKITGNVQGVAVVVTCTMVVAVDNTVTGACVDELNKSHPMTGTAKDMSLTWAYASEYEGTPITISWSGTIDATGSKMAGTIGVDPFGVDGDFTATMGSATTPAPTPAL